MPIPVLNNKVMMSAAITREQYAAILDTHPKPSIQMFSSDRARTSWKQREAHPYLYRLLDIIWAVVKVILGLIFFIPLGLFWVINKICQNFILPSAGGWICKAICRDSDLLRQVYAARLFSPSFQDRVSSAQRIFLQYDDLFIDGLKICFPNAKPDRWMLISNGNSDCLEYRTVLLEGRDWILRVAEESQSNVLIFNYPGVMRSRGNITKENLVKSFQGCVRYLRDEPEGPRARQIITYGYSLGASIQAESLSREKTDGSDGIRWFVIKDRGARSLGAVAKQFIGHLGPWMANLTNWNINSEKKSRTLRCPELFIYGKDCEGKLIGDGLFEKHTCFAEPFLDHKNLRECVGKKIPIAQIGLRHDEELSDEVITAIAGHVQRHFEN
nr:CPn0927/CPn0928 family alpha/beta hydrolase fold protein [Candidatus Chlamydia corallus]